MGSGADPTSKVADSYPAVSANLESTAAQETAKAPTREITYIHNIKIPISFESNTSLWFSVSQFTGKLNDLLGLNVGLDRHFAGRAFLFLSSLYLGWAETFYSHEAAHGQSLRNCGIMAKPYFEWGNWEAGVPGMHNLHHYGAIDETFNDVIETTYYEESLATISGLVQQKLNAQRQFRHNILSESLTYDEGIAYTMNKMSDLAYLWLTDFNLSSRFDIPRHLDHVNGRSLGGASNASLSRTHWLLGSLTSLLGSFHFYESILASAKYLSKGNRTYQPFLFKVGDRRIAPPDFELFPHPNGLFLNSELLAHNLLDNEEWWSFEIGTGINEGVNGLRLATSIFGLNPFPIKKSYIPTFDASIGLSLNTKRSSSSGGFGSLSVHIKPLPDLDLFFQTNYSNRDIMQNGIMGKNRAALVRATSSDPKRLPESLEFFAGASYTY